MTEIIIATRYVIKEEIGKGSFGIIHTGEHIVTHEKVAIKLQNNQTQSKQLRNESKIYKVLAGCPGVPQMHWFGTEGKNDVLVIELLGKSLENYHQLYPKFSLKTGLMIADQMLLLIQYMHERHFIHRDIKPDNFLVGSKNNQNIIHIIDFGLSKKYRDPKTKEHIPYAGDRELVGTARYVSINTHLGVEQSRRDDLESIGYVLVYLLKGSLPWQGCRVKNEHEKYEKIAEKKMATSFNSLCEGLPSEFVQYFETVRNLGFTDEPPYNQLRQMFRSLFIRMGFTYDYKYDWTDARSNDGSDNKDNIPVHTPMFQGAEAELVPPVLKEEREHPNILITKEPLTATVIARDGTEEKKEEPQNDENKEKEGEKEKEKIKKKKAVRIWEDPGKRRPFTRGPPPIPAKMLPPVKAKITRPKTRSLTLDQKNQLQLMFEKTKPEKIAYADKESNLYQLYGGELYPWTTMTTEEQVKLSLSSTIVPRKRRV